MNMNLRDRFEQMEWMNQYCSSIHEEMIQRALGDLASALVEAKILRGWSKHCVRLTASNAKTSGERAREIPRRGLTPFGK